MKTSTSDQTGKPQRTGDLDEGFDVVVERESHRVSMHVSLKKCIAKLWKTAHAATLELRRTAAVARTSKAETVVDKRCAMIMLLDLSTTRAPYYLCILCVLDGLIVLSVLLVLIFLDMLSVLCVLSASCVLSVLLPLSVLERFGHLEALELLGRAPAHLRVKSVLRCWKALSAFVLLMHLMCASC